MDIRNLRLTKILESTIFESYDGPNLVDMILEELFTRKMTGELPTGVQRCRSGYPLYHLSVLIDEFATARHAPFIARIQRWKDVRVEDPSIRNRLSSAFKRTSREAA